MLSIEKFLKQADVEYVGTRKPKDVPAGSGALAVGFPFIGLMGFLLFSIGGHSIGANNPEWMWIYRFLSWACATGLFTPFLVHQWAWGNRYFIYPVKGGWKVDDRDPRVSGPCLSILVGGKFRRLFGFGDRVLLDGVEHTDLKVSKVMNHYDWAMICEYRTTDRGVLDSKITPCGLAMLFEMLVKPDSERGIYTYLKRLTAERRFLELLCRTVLRANSSGVAPKLLGIGLGRLVLNSGLEEASWSEPQLLDFLFKERDRQKREAQQVQADGPHFSEIG